MEDNNKIRSVAEVARQQFRGFHHGRWLFDFKLSCGQGCDEGSFAHGRGFD
jgi:hypothetical protein